MNKEMIIAEIKDYMMNNFDGKIDSQVFGFRYDNILPEVGQILENSIANWDREDDRAFPEYDESSERMNGTSIYAVTFELDYMDSESEVNEAIAKIEDLISGSEETSYNHCSLVIGNDGVNTMDAEDEGEAIVENCTVVKVLF